MKWSFLFIISLLFSSLCHAQENQLSDHLGNKYLLSPTGLSKLDLQGNSVYQYTNPELGSIAVVDIYDPFRLLIYFSNQNSIIFLDNKLSPLMDPISLDDYSFFNPAGLCSSKNGGFWILDRTKQNLNLVNKRMELVSSLPLRLFNSSQDTPWFPMVEWKQNLYLLHPENYLYQFDLYGQLIKKNPTKALSMQLDKTGIKLILNDTKITK